MFFRHLQSLCNTIRLLTSWQNTISGIRCSVGGKVAMCPCDGHLQVTMNWPFFPCDGGSLSKRNIKFNPEVLTVDGKVTSRRATSGKTQGSSYPPLQLPEV